MDNSDKLRLLVQAYHQALGEGEVLKDLEEFCYINKSTFESTDPQRVLVCEGRRQVFLHIQRMLNTDFTQMEVQGEVEL